jgi:hypothetical protein
MLGYVEGNSVPESSVPIVIDQNEHRPLHTNGDGTTIVKKNRVHLRRPFAVSVIF